MRNVLQNVEAFMATGPSEMKTIIINEVREKMKSRGEFSVELLSTVKESLGPHGDLQEIIHESVLPLMKSLIAAYRDESDQKADMEDKISLGMAETKKALTTSMNDMLMSKLTSMTARLEDRIRTLDQMILKLQVKVKKQYTK